MPIKFMSRIVRCKKSHAIQHVCDLKKGSESHLPRLPPNAELTARFKRRLQKILLVSPNHPFIRFFLRSKAVIAFEKRRHGISPYWWIIHPCSSFRFVWDIIMTFVYLFMFIMIPHTICFHRLSPKGLAYDSSHDRFKILMPGYIMCLIDIFFNFTTGFISPDGREIFIDPMIIIKHYLAKQFLIDFISSIPYAWFYNEYIECPGAEAKLYLLFLELLPLLKLFRLPTLRHYIKEIVVACGASRVYEHAIWIFLLTVFIFHWAACLTYAFPLFYAYIMRTPKEEAQSYLFNTKLYQESYWLIYLTSLHMGGANLCGYNFSEFEFIDLPDKVPRCILLLCGMTFFLYVIVIVLQLVTSSAEPELKYQSIMYGVKDYINNKKLPTQLRHKLLHFYEHRFQGSLFKEKTITTTLSKHLKHEITQHSSRIVLEATPLFYNIPRSLINSIIGALKQVIFLQDDIIYKCNMVGKCMYFIITGTVAILTFSGKEVCHVSDGEYFGEFALIEHEHNRVTTAIALEVCEVLRLDRRDFNRLIQPKSEFLSRLEALAAIRHQLVTDAERRAKEYSSQVDN